MANTINSLSTMLSQLITLNQNSLQIFERINEAVTTNKETVDIDLFDSDNNINKIQIPSFGFLKNEIERLNNNVNNLAGINNNSNVRLPDGSFRKVITSGLKMPGKNITNVQSPVTFNYKNNWFFEEFLNPLLYINIDISGQINNNSERVIIKKYILELDTESKKQFFEDNFLDNSSIDYVEFNNKLLEQNISFIPDEKVKDIPPIDIRYKGKFNILDINNEETEEIVDGVTSTVRKKYYKLNKLTYTDLESGFEDTVSLKVGDTLGVNSENPDTRYKVKEIDSSTNNVVLELYEGYKNISIGTDQLFIYNETDRNIDIEVPISFDKYNVIFFKSVDPESMIPSANWSPGIGFFTNTLTLQDSENDIVNLDTFYRNEVTDFGLFMLSMAKDRNVPATLSLIPNIPEFSPNDLKVVQINNHITDNPVFKDIKKLAEERNNLSKEIKELDLSIKNKRGSISTINYKNNTAKEKDKSELDSLINQRASSSKLFASIVEDISNRLSSDELVNALPKYRIRGFIPLPEPKTSKYTGAQEIIALEYEYRYISNTGNSNKPDQFKVSGENGTENIAAQSNWIKGDLNVRSKVKNSETGELEWEEQDLKNPEQININQIDIPIKRNESVEIRVRSLSEAGYPSSPTKSEWSSIQSINFPEDIVQSNTVESIIEENNKEEQRVKLEQDLAARGLLDHINDQFSSNDKTFKHSALNIFSGEVTNEQTPINLFDKLQTLTNKLNAIEEQLANVKGELSVKIIDENGEETPIEKNVLTKKFAGYYSSIVKDLDIKKGAIVTKTYFITLENIKATTLELMSRIYGDRTKMVFESGGKFGSTNIDNNIISDVYYVNRAKYDYVPLLYTNPSDPSEDYINNSPYQSGQLRGQFMYSRYKNISATTDFYIDFNIDNGNIISSVQDAEYSYNGNLYVATNNPNDFVWAGSYIGNTPNTTDISNTISEYDSNNNILLHADHPLIKNNNETPSDIIDNRLVINTKTATLKDSDDHGKKQTGFFTDNGNYIKTAFETNDQYTLGRASVGSYMFISPSDENELLVNGDDALSIKQIQFGQNNSIKIPLVFQFRMTDYGGVGDSGIGFIGGDRTGATTDLTYSKKMGFDIISTDGTQESRFSFDIEIYAKYKSDSLNIENIPSQSISNAISSLNNNLSSGNPTIQTIN